MAYRPKKNVLERTNSNDSIIYSRLLTLRDVIKRNMKTRRSDAADEQKLLFHLRSLMNVKLMSAGQIFGNPKPLRRNSTYDSMSLTQDTCLTAATRSILWQFLPWLRNHVKADTKYPGRLRDRSFHFRTPVNIMRIGAFKVCLKADRINHKVVPNWCTNLEIKTLHRAVNVLAFTSLRVIKKIK